MTEEGAGYAEALAEAQSLGYAERDPTADVEGFDAGAKAAILASIAFGAEVVAGDVYHEGISRHHRRRHRLRRPPRLRRQAAGHRRAGRGDDGPESRCGCTRRWCPTPTRWPGARQLQRGVRRGRRGRRPHVLRPRGRRRAHGLARCSATSSTPRPTCRKGTHAASATSAGAASARSTSCASAYYLNLEVVDRPGVLRRGGRGVRAPRRVDPLHGAGGARRGAPASSSSPTWPARPTCRPRSTTCAASTWSRRSAACCGSSATTCRRPDGEEQAVHYVSTRGKAPELGFADVLLAGLAPDGGLYVPEEWPTLARRAGRRPATPTPRSAVMWPFVEGSIERADFEAIVAEAYADLRPPRRGARRRSWPTASTWPSCSGARRWRSRTSRCSSSAGCSTTSCTAPGRAGHHRRSPPRATPARRPSRPAAAAPHLDIVVLHPAGRVSEVQRRQMTTVDEPNVHNVAVDGTFDDCQDLVKAMFADEAFRDEVRLSAMNSINWARVMAQIVYYVTAPRPRRPAATPVTFAVPTGNFGNVLAGLGGPAHGPARSRSSSSARTATTSSPAGFDDRGRWRWPSVHPDAQPAAWTSRCRRNLERLLFELLRARRRGGGRADGRASATDGRGRRWTPRAWRWSARCSTARRFDDDATRPRSRRTYARHRRARRPAHRGRSRRRPAPPGATPPLPDGRAGHRPPGQVPRRRRGGHRRAPAAARPPRPTCSSAPRRSTALPADLAMLQEFVRTHATPA